MKNLSTLQLADYLFVTKRTIQRRANKEKWPFVEQKGLGGVKRVYVFAGLPEKVKIKVVAGIVAGHERRQEGDEAIRVFADVVENQPMVRLPLYDDALGENALDENIIDTYDEADSWLAQHCFSRQLEAAELTKDFVRLGILSLARLYVTQSELGKIRGFDHFCQLYNNQELKINKAVFCVVKRVSRITLLRWEKNGLPRNLRFEQADLAANYSDKAFEQVLKSMADEVMMVVPNITAKRLRHHFETFFDDKPIPSEYRIARWIDAM